MSKFFNHELVTSVFPFAKKIANLVIYGPHINMAAIKVELFRNYVSSTALLVLVPQVQAKVA